MTPTRFPDEPRERAEFTAKCDACGGLARLTSNLYGATVIECRCGHSALVPRRPAPERRRAA